MAESTPTGDASSNLAGASESEDTEEKVAQLTALLAVAEEQLTELRAQVADHQSGGNELDALKEAKKEILRLSQKVKELESNQGGAPAAADSKAVKELEDKLKAKDAEIADLKELQKRSSGSPGGAEQHLRGSMIELENKFAMSRDEFAAAEKQLRAEAEEAIEARQHAQNELVMLAEKVAELEAKHARAADGERVEHAKTQEAMTNLQIELDKKNAELKETAHKHSEFMKDFRPELFDALKKQVESMTEELNSARKVEKNATSTLKHAQEDECAAREAGLAAIQAAQVHMGQLQAELAAARQASPDGAMPSTGAKSTGEEERLRLVQEIRRLKTDLDCYSQQTLQYEEQKRELLGEIEHQVQTIASQKAEIEEKNSIMRNHIDHYDETVTKQMTQSSSTRGPPPVQVERHLRIKVERENKTLQDQLARLLVISKSQSAELEIIENQNRKRRTGSPGKKKTPSRN